MLWTLLGIFRRLWNLRTLTHAEQKSMGFKKTKLLRLIRKCKVDFACFWFEKLWIFASCSVLVICGQSAIMCVVCSVINFKQWDKTTDIIAPWFYPFGISKLIATLYPDCWVRSTELLDYTKWTTFRRIFVKWSDWHDFRLTKIRWAGNYSPMH